MAPLLIDPTIDLSSKVSTDRQRLVKVLAIQEKEITSIPTQRAIELGQTALNWLEIKAPDSADYIKEYMYPAYSNDRLLAALVAITAAILDPCPAVKARPVSNQHGDFIAAQINAWLHYHCDSIAGSDVAITKHIVLAASLLDFPYGSSIRYKDADNFWIGYRKGSICRSLIDTTPADISKNTMAY